MGTATKLLDLDAAKSIGGDLETSSQSLAQRFGSLAITDPATLAQAVEDRSAIAAAVRNVETFFGPFKQMAHRLHAALCEREREILAPLRALDRQRVDAIRDYSVEQDRQLRQREQDDAERLRAEAQTRAIREAAALEAAGQPTIAEAVLAESIAAPAPVVTHAAPTVEGLKFRKRYLWRYSGGPADIETTPAAIVARTLAIIPREFLVVDEQKISAYARAMRGNGTIPGIEFYDTKDPVR
jgi:hypothetical protein